MYDGAIKNCTVGGHPAVLANKSIYWSKGLLAGESEQIGRLVVLIVEVPCFPSQKGLGFERWGFWQRRLTGLQKDVSESVYASIDETLETMTKIEMEVANTRR